MVSRIFTFSSACLILSFNFSCVVFGLGVISRDLFKVCFLESRLVDLDLDLDLDLEYLECLFLSFFDLLSLLLLRLLREEYLSESLSSLLSLKSVSLYQEILKYQRTAKNYQHLSDFLIRIRI